SGRAQSMRRGARRGRRKQYVGALHEVDKSAPCLSGETARVIIGGGRDRRRLVELLAQDRAELVAVAIDLVGESSIGFVILDRAMRLRGGFKDGRKLPLRHFCARSLGGARGARDGVLHAGAGLWPRLRPDQRDPRRRRLA